MLRGMEASPAPPWVYIFIGAVLSGLGGFLFALDDPTTLSTAVSLVLLWLGSVLTLAGVVALGVQVGSTRAEWRRRKAQR